MYEAWGKRLLDIAVAGAALVVLSPLLGLIAVLVWLGDRHAPLFRQGRLGRDGVPFTLVKFRTMPVQAPHVESASARTLPVTRLGGVLRRTNLDELPQLVNIVAGDMSIVGPRPALPSQEELIEMRRANGAIRCRPGLTGLAQVNSYDGMPPAEKARLDAGYASRVAFLNDAWIIVRTFGYLVRRPPVY